MSDSEFLRGEPLAGKYEVAASVSRGSHFNVYLAYHTRFGWPVALKVLRAASASDEQLAQHVLDEFELVSRQAHPNLVPIYEVGRTSAGLPFAAMAYLERVGRPSDVAALKAFAGEYGGAALLWERGRIEDLVRT
ncbi:MAG: hypothetical protein ACK2UH_02745, partial [Candidatus Promineifilaceae bacterium]